MNRRTFLGTLAGGLLTAPLAAEGQQSPRIYRIGYLGPGSSSTLPPALDAFRQQLRQLGYVEGQNLTIEYRWAADKDEQLSRLAADLVRLKVDVIVVEGHTPAIQAAKNATSTIPIVMGVSGDPVKMGLVESLARPGGNVTGLSIMTPGLAPKRLELLREVVPKLKHVAVLWNAANPVKVLGLARDASRGQSPGTEAPYREFVDEGGLMSYAPSFTDLFRRAAVYVDRILKGTKPADLPVEQPEKFGYIAGNSLVAAKSKTCLR